LHAKALLADPERSITSVAFDVGFQDPDYFGKVFKEAFGQTPSEFRQEPKA
jgi:two-component system response regulator YesN